MSIKILQTVKKTPEGLMIVPLLLGAIVSTFFGNVLWSASDGIFTTYPWKPGAMPVLAVFIFCNATTINFKRAGVTAYKGMLITTVKVGVDIIIGLICGALFEEKGLLGLSTLAIVDALANSSDGPYVVLVGEYGDATDVDAIFILSINDGPFFTMAALEAASVAKISMSILIGCTVPVTVGCTLGNLNEGIHKFCEPGAIMLIPFSTFPLRTGLNIMSLLKTGSPGILLGVAYTLITGPMGYLVYKLLRMDHPEVGGAIRITTGNAVTTPASIAAVDITPLAAMEATTAQITAVITVTAVLCPVLISYLHKIEVCKRGR